ncbi:MAG: DUF2079 domain-containing protein [Candidatus Dormibacteraceae bacterium]
MSQYPSCDATGLSQSRLSRWLIVLPSAFAGLIFSITAWVLLRRADQLSFGAFDTAFFQQLLWNLAHGGSWHDSFDHSIYNYLGVHFSPLLAVLAPLELIWADARMLNLLNAAGLAAIGPTAFLFFQALLGDRPKAALAAVALATPLPFWAEIQKAAMAGFHPESIGLPLVLLAAWAGLQNRQLLCWILVLAALATKEDQAFELAVVGLLLFRYGPSPRLGKWLGLFSLAWGMVLELVLMHWLRGNINGPIEGYYHWLLSASPQSVTGALVHSPEGWLAFVGMLASVAFLPLLRPVWFALVLPPLLGDLLSQHFPMPTLGLQYGLPLIMPLLVAAGLGMRKLLNSPRPAVLLIGLGIPALIVGLVWSPMLGGNQASPARTQLISCTHKLPVLASVAADYDTAAPLASRPDIHLTDAIQRTDFVVIDQAGWNPDYISSGRQHILASLPNQRPLLCNDGRFQIWGPAR